MYLVIRTDGDGDHEYVYHQWREAFSRYSRFTRWPGTIAVRLIKRSKYVDEVIAEWPTVAGNTYDLG